MDNYIHIPKTGGTAIKYALEQHNPGIYIQNAGHNQTIDHFGKNVCFILRDPIERIVSGFWERRNMYKRWEMSKTVDYTNFGYSHRSQFENDIMANAQTPNEYISLLRGGLRVENTILGELTGSLQRWLGRLDYYKTIDHKVKRVFWLRDLNVIFEKHYGIQLPSDGFRARSKTLFGDVDDTISITNQLWVQNTYREADYEMISYITSQPYFEEA